VSFVKLTVLGCSGSVPGPRRASSGYLLEAEGFRLLIELGSGVFSRLQEEGRDPFDLDAIAFSHLHPDHCEDFSALTVWRCWHPLPPFNTRQRRLPVYAPEGAATRFANAYAPDEESRSSTELAEVYEFHELREDSFSLGPFEITPIKMFHVTSAFGFRISHGGTTLAYTGDTGPCAALDVLAKDADVLLAEASWTDSPSRPEGLHLSGRQVGALARRSGVGTLLVTHVPPWTDRAAVLAEARAEFPNAELVEQGAVYGL
jgi:ribonuclease BN (tRNA processing enzyme)